MKALLTTTMALGVVFTLGAIQPVNAAGTNPNSAGGYDQGNIVLAHGHGGGFGGGHGHGGGWGGGHGGGWGGGYHHGYGYGGYGGYYGGGGGIFLDEPVFIDPGYDYEYYDSY